MRTLYLHVGQDKTGSSFIQSALVNSLATLKENKIFYPTNKKILLAKEGRISSGNAGLLFSEVNDTYESLKSDDSILISGEQLFRHIPQEDFFERLLEFKSKYEVDEIKCLLYIREPMEHLSSAYQQAIKRGGYSGTIEDFATRYMHTKKVYDFVSFCKKNNEIKLDIINYSKKSQHLLNTFEDWLSMPASSLTAPKTAVVNRSMTRAELEFQRVINTYLGKDGSFISDSLCEKLPYIKSDKVGIPQEVQIAVLTKLKPYCEYINSFSCCEQESDAYSMSLLSEESSSLSYDFTKEQVNVIAESMHKYYSKVD